MVCCFIDCNRYRVGQTPGADVSGEVADFFLDTGVVKEADLFTVVVVVDSTLILVFIVGGTYKLEYNNMLLVSMFSSLYYALDKSAL